MALLDTIDWNCFIKSFEGKAVDQSSRHVRRHESEPGSGCEINLVRRRNGLDAGRKRKGVADEVAVLKRDVTQRDYDAYRQAVVTPTGCASRNASCISTAALAAPVALENSNQ